MYFSVSFVMGVICIHEQNILLFVQIDENQLILFMCAIQS